MNEVATYKELKIVPPRFRTVEDARLFERCLVDGSSFPIDKWVAPYVMLDGRVVLNPEYRDARYEMRYINQKTMI